MAEEFRSFDSINSHRIQWIHLLFELHKKRKPILSFASNEKNLKHKSQTSKEQELPCNQNQSEHYSKLYQYYEELLERQQKLLAMLHIPYGRYSYVPIPYALFFDEESSKVSNICPPEIIDLSHLNVNARELVAKRPGHKGELVSLLFYYKEVDLSNNAILEQQFPLKGIKKIFLWVAEGRPRNSCS